MRLPWREVASHQRKFCILGTACAETTSLQRVWGCMHYYWIDLRRLMLRNGGNQVPLCFLTYGSKRLAYFRKLNVTPRLLQKDVSKNFDFYVILRHHQSYRLVAEYFFFLTLTHQSF